MGQNNSKGKERSQDNSDTLVVPNLKVSNSYSEQNLSQLQLTSTSKSVLNFDHYPTNFISIKSRATLKSNDNLKDEHDNNIIKNRNIFNLFKWSSRSRKRVNNECKDTSEKCKCKYLIIINEMDQISKESTEQLGVGNSLTVSKISRNKLLLEKLTTKTLMLNKSLIMFNTAMSRQICNLSKQSSSGSKLCVQKNCKRRNFIKNSFIGKKSTLPSIENAKPTQLKILDDSSKKKSNGSSSIKKRTSFCLPNISSVLRKKKNNKLSLSDTFCYNFCASIIENNLVMKGLNLSGDNGTPQKCALLNESLIFGKKQSWCDRYTSTTLATVDKYSQCSSQNPTLDIFLFPNLINIAPERDKFSQHADSKLMQKHLEKIKLEPSDKRVKIEQSKSSIHEISSKNYVYIPTERYSFRSKSLNKLHKSKAESAKRKPREDKNPILDRILQLNVGDNNSIVELKFDRAMYTSSENLNLLDFSEKDETHICSKEFSGILVNLI